SSDLGKRSLEQLAPGANVRAVVEQFDTGEETFRLIRVVQFDNAVDLAFQVIGAKVIGHHDPDIDVLANWQRLGDVYLHAGGGNIHGGRVERGGSHQAVPC